MNEPYINDECVVLKRIPLNENDAIIVFLGSKMGKIRTFSKGLGKPSSKLSALLSVGNVVSVNLFEGKAGYTLLSATQSIVAPRGSQSYETLLTKVYLCDLVDEGLMPDLQEREIFDLIVNVINNIGDRNFVESRLYFEWRFLYFLGYVSDSRDDFYAMWRVYWKITDFSVRQTSMVDEMYTVLSYNIVSGKSFCGIQLSKDARKELSAFLSLMYKKHVGTQIKSKRILDEATIHFYS